jgi:formate/nitrite transporter FocA (FNT family)
MHRSAAIATGIILLNLLVAFVHGQAHQELDVQLSSWQLVYVAATNIIGPILALILYWTPFRRVAALLLFVSMLATLLFGITFHFIFTSNDHIAHLPEGHGQPLFIATALLLVPAQALGAIFGLWSWRRLRKWDTR